ncbi:hypothetical protein IWW45_005384, partial [Coemansia sp. RSA 485]
DRPVDPGTTDNDITGDQITDAGGQDLRYEDTQRRRLWNRDMAAVPNFRKTLMAHRMGNERPENLQRPKSKDKASDTAASKPKRTRKKAAAAALAILLQARPDHANVLGSVL